MNAFLRLLRVTGWSLLVLLVLSLVISGVLMGVMHEFARDGALHAGQWHVVVDGEDLGDVMALRDTLSLNAEDGLGALAALFFGTAAVVLCLFIVVPLTLLLGIGVPLVAILFAFGAVAVALTSAAALVAAPLLLPILLVVWLIRRDRRPKVVHPAAA